MWRYHPRAAAPLLAKTKLEGGRVLFAGRRGERWLYDPRAKSAVAASGLAPEDLVSIQKTEGGWLFIGESGTAYEAREPAGAFVRTASPVEPLARAAAAGDVIVGVRRRDGALVRSADGAATWHEVGPVATRFSAVALLDEGAGLALAVPEALYATRDRGASWARVDAPTFGALELGRGAPGAIRVSSMLGQRTWSPSAPGSFSPAVADSPKRPEKLPVAPERGPDAEALLAGRAIVVGGRYLELARPTARARKWIAVTGRFAGRLEERPLPVLDDCADVRVAGFGAELWVACVSADSADTVQGVTLWHSPDGGAHFLREPYPIRAKLGSLALAAGASGALIVTGLCAPPTPEAPARGCSPSGVLHRRARATPKSTVAGRVRAPAAAGEREPRAPVVELAPAATPALRGSALGLAASVDGRILYAVGRRTKNGALAVYVSHDGGHRFDARDLEGLPPEYLTDAFADERYGSHYQRSSDSLRVVSLRAAEDGSVALVLARSSTTTLVVTDDEGRTLSVARAPDDARLVGATGTRALSISRRTDEGWESLDGGSTWTPIGRLPAALCAQPERCEVGVACVVDGCVLGDTLSRLGWRGQADDDEGVVPPARPLLPPLAERRLRTALSCVTDDGGWQRLRGVARLPSVDQAALADVAWFAAASNDDTASVAILEATGGARPRVEAVSLLPPSRAPERLAVAMSYQLEGVAALRYVVPESVPGGSRLRDVELGWANLVEGRVGHARIADGGAYAPGDYVRGSGRAQVARPALMSIVTGGIAVRLRAQPSDEQPTLFTDGHATTVVPPVSWPSVLGSSHRDLVRIGGVFVPFLTADAGFVRARRSGDGWAFDAVSLARKDPRAFDQSAVRLTTYADGTPAQQVVEATADGVRRSSQVFPMRADGALVGAPIPVPTQLDYQDLPPRCSKTQRVSTPRVIQGYFQGTRHPILVSDASEPPRLFATDFAVMHGTPEHPCVAAFGVERIPLESSAPPVAKDETALVPIDDLEHAWLFRKLPGAPDVEYRTMSCRFDASAEVPEEIFGADGTQVLRR